MRLPYLRRNLPFSTSKLSEGANSTEEFEYRLPIQSKDGLVIRISPNNYHIVYDKETRDWWVQSMTTRKKGLGAYEELKQKRKEGFERLVNSKEMNPWMNRSSEDEVKAMKETFEAWIKSGPANGAAHDAVMADA